jgi:hypothetical protein
LQYSRREVLRGPFQTVVKVWKADYQRVIERVNGKMRKNYGKSFVKTNLGWPCHLSVAFRNIDCVL